MALPVWSRRAVTLAVGTMVLACQPDREHPTEPPDGLDDPPRGAFNIAGVITCGVDVRAVTVSCRPRPLVAGKVGPQFLIVGGQGVFVQLVSTNVSYSAITGVFQADVQVANLLGDEPGVGQELGTPDGSQATGIRVFFHAGPTVTGGTGTATVRNPDGTGMFTGSNQPYHEYNVILPPFFISPPKTWEWDVTNTVTTFEFDVFVEADVPYPDGFVQVSPEAATTLVGGNVTIAASVRDVVNRVVSGTVAFSTSDPSVASVNPVTGVVTGVGPGTARITATSGGSEAAGVATVMIPASGFQIRLQYLTGATASQQQAFANAVARWQSHLTGDLTDAAVNSSGLPFCGGVPVNEIVDDLVIQVILGPIDGPGQILGQAGPCVLRGVGGLPAWGIMQFDTDDLVAIEATNRLEAVILHEMGHVLGSGTLWGDVGLRLGTGTADPRFTGPAAIATYVSIGGTGAQCSPPFITAPCVPVEGTGGPGTRDGHWREDSCGTCQSADYFGNELMTGFISAPGVPNPLSTVTLNQFTDLGYPVVSTVGADPFTLNPTATAPALMADRLQLVDDVWRGPVYRIEDDRTLKLVRPDRR